MITPIAAWLLACATEPKTAPEAPEPLPARDAAVPDIVVITLDTLRADHLRAYGYYRDTAPALEALAAESVVFERAIAPMSTTLPSHTSLFTAVYPDEHGVLANVLDGGMRFVPSDSLVSFASYASSIGYHTAGFVSAAPLKKGTGIERGFAHWDEPERAERKAEETTDAALRWLGEPRDGAVFLWVHYYDIHGPYRPPAAYRDRFATDEALLEWMADRRIRELVTQGRGRVDVARRHNRYDGEIAYVDDQVDRLLDALRGGPRWDETVILVVSDHGEGLYQHGEKAHGDVWHEQVHIPAFLRVPGTPPGRVPHVVSMIDLLPTMLARVDLPNEPAFLAQATGRDALAPDWTPRPALSRRSDRHVTEFGRHVQYALTTEQWKYIRPDGMPARLYGLERDPHEQWDVLDAYPEARRELDGTLDRMLEAQRRKGEAHGAGRTEQVGADVVNQLAELGYVEEE